MPGRLGPRFALEAAFLIALAVAMGLGEFDATAIVIVMAVAWLLVALVEWLASRGSGYPPPPAWRPPPYPPPAGAPPVEGWREPEPVTELVAPAQDDDATPAEPLPAVAEKPKRRWLRRRRDDEGRADR
jgi:hypothetical protein